VAVPFWIDSIPKAIQSRHLLIYQRKSGHSRSRQTWNLSLLTLPRNQLLSDFGTDSSGCGMKYSQDGHCGWLNEDGIFRCRCVNYAAGSQICPQDIEKNPPKTCKEVK
jgi:hypothetical protein